MKGELAADSTSGGPDRFASLVVALIPPLLEHDDLSPEMRARAAEAADLIMRIAVDIFRTDGNTLREYLNAVERELAPDLPTELEPAWVLLFGIFKSMG